MNQLLKKKELAAHLRVTTRTVDRWVALGLLAKVVIGGTVRFRLEDCQALIHKGLTSRI